MGKVKPNTRDQREWEFQRLIETVSRGIKEIDDSPNFSGLDSKIIQRHMIEGLSRAALGIGVEVKGGISNE